MKGEIVVLRYDHFSCKLRDEDLLLPENNIPSNILAKREISELKSFIESNFSHVNSIDYVRNGNHYVCELNNRYIIRIRRLHSKAYFESESVASNILDTLNEELNIEILLVNHINYIFNKVGFKPNPIIEYIKMGFYEGHRFGLYKKIDGFLFEPRKEKDILFDGKRFASILSTLHSVSAVSAGSTNSEEWNNSTEFKRRSRFVRQINKFIDTICGECVQEFDAIISIDLKNKILSLARKLAKYYESICLLDREPVVIHNGLEWGHVLHDGNNISGLIDWEHHDYCFNGWKDLSDIYSNFIVPWVNDSSSRFIYFWNSIIGNYVCTHLERSLSQNEIRLIKSLGVMQTIIRFCTKLKNNKETTVISTKRERAKIISIQEMISDLSNKLISQDFL